ncbi:hypothetical protein B0T13DRAFT_475593 [Neurospora crassa]|nr:hypothetical protein B0T13DRAFT_475593 [Neurospora crassa]
MGPGRELPRQRKCKTTIQGQEQRSAVKQGYQQKDGTRKTWRVRRRSNENDSFGLEEKKKIQLIYHSFFPPVSPFGNFLGAFIFGGYNIEQEKRKKDTRGFRSEFMKLLFQPIGRLVQWFLLLFWFEEDINPHQIGQLFEIL